MTMELKEYILCGEFVTAHSLIKNLDYNEKLDKLALIAFDTGRIEIYFFILSLIEKDENAENHYLAADILCGGLCYITGAYNAALYHARKASQLAPNDTSYLEHLLLYYNIPERLIYADEALAIANTILEVNPKNVTANDIKQRLTK